MRMAATARSGLLALLALTSWACGQAAPAPSSSSGVQRPSILLITLDTTRADAVGVENDAGATPHLDALAARGVWFEHAYSTAPLTLPAHASMLTGRYPAAHGVHDNGRTLGGEQPLLAVRLAAAGYRTAAFVSGFPLARPFGLARGFAHYDDHFAPAAERAAADTTERALAYLERAAGGPLFLWVHYFDPHEPYAPPEPYRSRYPGDPYLGEIAAMDAALGRLLAGFERHAGARPVAVLAVGDHGEGRGEHGEALHGNLLYQGVMRVPLIAAGSGVAPGRREQAVSIRRVFDTVLAWAGLEAGPSLLEGAPETVVGEAMKPYFHYGWQPQVMAVRDGLKAIRSGTLELYDLAADPGETADLAADRPLDRALRQALQAYPFPPEGPRGGGEAALDPESWARLASLGYAGWEGRAILRDDAPSPRHMSHLFAALDHGSGLFVDGRYAESIPVFQDVLAADPHNLMVCLRLAVAHSVTGDEAGAVHYFERARTIDPGSVDVRHYQAMHHLRRGQWTAAGPLFESVLAQMPARLPALEGLATVRERQGRLREAGDLLARATALGAGSETWLRLGRLRMAAQDTEGAIVAFEQARAGQGARFAHHLELGVLYLAARRPGQAAAVLDQVPPDHPAYPMALFKRAQASVLLAEPDRAAHIQRARDAADATTRRLIADERLFRGVR